MSKSQTIWAAHIFRAPKGSSSQGSSPFAPSAFPSPPCDRCTPLSAMPCLESVAAVPYFWRGLKSQMWMVTDGKIVVTMHRSQTGRGLRWGQEDTKRDHPKLGLASDPAEEREAAPSDALWGRRPHGEAPWKV